MMSPKELAEATARLSQDAAAPLVARGVITEPPRPSNLAASRRFLLPELPNLNPQRSSTERPNGNVPGAKRPVPSAKRPASASQNSFASKKPSSYTSGKKPAGVHSSSTSRKQPPAKRPPVVPGLSDHGPRLRDPRSLSIGTLQAPRMHHHLPSPTFARTPSRESRMLNRQPSPFRAISQAPRIQSRLPPNTVARKAPRKAIVTDSPPPENRVHGVKRSAETDHEDRSTKVPRTTLEFTRRAPSLIEHINALQGVQPANPSERPRQKIRYHRIPDDKVVSPPKSRSATTTPNSLHGNTVQGVKRRAETDAGHHPTKIRRILEDKVTSPLTSTSKPPQDDNVQGVKRRADTDAGDQPSKIRRLSDGATKTVPQEPETTVQEDSEDRPSIRRARRIVLDEEDEDDIIAAPARPTTPKRNVPKRPTVSPITPVETIAERNAPRRPTVSPLTPIDPKAVNGASTTSSSSSSSRRRTAVAGPRSAGKPVSSRTRSSTQEPKPATKPSVTQRGPKAVPKKAAAPKKEPRARQARAPAKSVVVVANIAAAAPGAAKAARNPALVVPRYHHTMPGDLRSVMTALGQDTWNEYLAHMEQKCLAQISEEEMRRRSRALFALQGEALRGKINRMVEDVVQSTLGRVLRDDEERRRWAGDMAVQPSIES